MSSSRMNAPTWERFTKPFYVANAMLIASYAIIRLWHLQHNNGEYSKLQHPLEILPRERQGLSLLLIMLLLKFYKRQSTDAFLSDVFFFSKSVVALMLWYMDIRIFVYYILIIIVFFLSFPQPVYKGPARIEYFTPASFKELVEDRTGDDNNNSSNSGADGEGDDSSSSSSPPAWIVSFFAPWAPQCIYLEPVIAELSLKYTNPQTLRWGKVDVSRWPSLAKDYNISLQGASPQLPTLALFVNGKEQGRIPHVFADGRVSGGKIRREDIVAGFKLDELLKGKKKKRKVVEKKKEK